MARLEARRWAGVGGGLTRRDRRPCDYQVYIPDPVGRQNLMRPTDTHDASLLAPAC